MNNVSGRPAIVIPAHNEVNVIGRLLSELAPAAISGEMDVIVSCNGCDDGTEEYVTSNYPFVTCLSQRSSSKIKALNYAEKSGIGFPRVYIDADIEIDLFSIRRLIHTVEKSSVPVLAVPKAILILDGASWVVKAYYNAWMKTTFYRQQGFGGGVFALNREARSTFDGFPDLIADDTYVRYSVGLHNIAIVPEAFAKARVPKTLSSLVRVLSRVKLGNYQLDKIFGQRSGVEAKYSAYTGLSFVDLALYVAINGVAQIAARRLQDKLDSYRWGRDETSRV